jgi:hypothetical protein
MWTAIYDDESQLKQYEDGREVLFKEIDQSRLTRFIVSNEKGEVIVNTKTGEIKVNGIKLDFGYGDIEYRLIYFRRVRQTLGSGTESTTNEYAGWQATIQGSEGPQNVKRIIGNEEGKFTIQCD